VSTTPPDTLAQRAHVIADDDFLDKDARYARTAEFLRVVRALWAGETDEHIRVAGARLEYLPDPVPPVYFGGSSPAAVRVAAAFGEGVLPLLHRRGLWRPPAGSGIGEARPAAVPFARVQ